MYRLDVDIVETIRRHGVHDIWTQSEVMKISYLIMSIFECETDNEAEDRINMLIYTAEMAMRFQSEVYNQTGSDDLSIVERYKDYFDNYLDLNLDYELSTWNSDINDAFKAYQIISTTYIDLLLNGKRKKRK